MDDEGLKTAKDIQCHVEGQSMSHTLDVELGWSRDVHGHGWCDEGSVTIIIFSR